MSNQLNLFELTTDQLTNLLRTLKGTPQAQLLYRELSCRSPQLNLKPDDADWESKLTLQLTHHFSSADSN